MATKTCRILCFGDSLTAGFHNYGHSFAPYSDVLKENVSNSEISTVGFSGWTTTQMLDNANEESCPDVVGKKWPGLKCVLRTQTFDLAIVMAGTNDLGHGRSSEDIVKNLVSIYDIAKEFKVKRILSIGIPDAGYHQSSKDARDRKLMVNKMLRNYSDKSNNFVHYIDCPIKYEPKSDLFESDGLHFSYKGYRTLGESLCVVINNLC